MHIAMQVLKIICLFFLKEHTVIKKDFVCEKFMHVL